MPASLRLGNYETESLLGTCGAVETYAARRTDAPPGSGQVVIKLLRPDRVPAAEWSRISARFLTAARRMQTAQPGMGRVLGISEWSGDLMVVSEMAPGLDLRHLMALGHQETGQLGLDGALVAMLGGEIARVLADAHASNPPLLHLGLGLGNVLVAPDGQVTVVDFGLCASLRGQMDHPIDKWFLLGPELLSAGANELTPTLGKRADLYSLGALMYAMATGEPPFKASSRAQLAELARGTVPAIPGVPASLNAAIRALTAPDPDDRPASADEVIAWLVPGKDTPTQRQEKRAAALRSFFLGLKTPPPVVLPSPTVAPATAAKPPAVVAPVRKPRRAAFMAAGVFTVFAGAGIAAFLWAQHYAERSNGAPVAHTGASAQSPAVPAKFNPELPAPAAHTASPDAQPDVPADAEAEGDAAHVAVPAPKRKLPRIPERLDINTEPEGADIWVDGVLMGKTPADLLVGPGGHRVVVIAAGHRMFREVYNTTDGEYVRRPLEPIVAASRGSAFVNVTCRTPNRFPVLVDDEETGQLCPARMIPVAPGKHQVSIFVPVRRGTIAAEISLPEGPKPYVVTFKE